MNRRQIQIAPALAPIIIATGVTCASRSSVPNPAPLPGYSQLMEGASQAFAGGDYAASATFARQAATAAPDQRRRIQALIDTGWSHVFACRPQEVLAVLHEICALGGGPQGTTNHFPGRNGSSLEELFSIPLFAQWPNLPACNRYAVRPPRPRGKLR